MNHQMRFSVCVCLFAWEETAFYTHTLKKLWLGRNFLVSLFFVVVEKDVSHDLSFPHRRKKVASASKKDISLYMRKNAQGNI